MRVSAHRYKKKAVVDTLKALGALGFSSRFADTVLPQLLPPELVQERLEGFQRACAAAVVQQRHQADAAAGRAESDVVAAVAPLSLTDAVPVSAQFAGLGAPWPGWLALVLPALDADATGHAAAAAGVEELRELLAVSEGYIARIGACARVLHTPRKWAVIIYMRLARARCRSAVARP